MSGGTCGVILILGIVLIAGFQFLNTGLAEDKPTELIVGLALTSIPLLSLVGFILGRLRRRVGWSGRGVALTTFVISMAAVTGIAIFLRSLIVSNRPAEQILASLSGVCQGQSVPEAGSFDPANPGTPHIVVLNAAGNPDEWSSTADPEWKPASLEEAELVLCLGETKVLVDEGCGYRRTGEELEVWLVAARTGETIATKTLESGMPGCVLVKSGATDTSGNIGFSKVEGWVERVISAPTPEP